MNTLLADAKRFAEFILQNYPGAKEWIDPVQQTAWYISHCFVAAVLGDDGEIVALGSARPVERPGLGVLPFYFNEGGKCLHIDLWIDNSGDEKACRALSNICKMRFPQCKVVTMFRHFEGQLHVYEINRFWKSLEKIKSVKRRKKEKQYAGSKSN
jgi:hypothetical protein